MRAGFGVAEGLAGDGDTVDPGLELGRHGEVVHRRSQHHGVGVEEFLQGLGAEFGLVLLRGIAQFFRGTGSHQGRGREVADGVAGQVTVGHLQRRVGGFPGFNHAAAQLTGGGIVAQDARIDMQQFHGTLLNEDREWAITMGRILLGWRIADK
ncbi:hypothetical protein D3C80_629230 [compost metagenome]